MDKRIFDFIEQAEAKALATYADDCLNVVPVSSIRIVDEKIWLINYFMEKTETNILRNNKVALVCWSDMAGFQIKGTCSYLREGPEFEQAKDWIKGILPDRTVKGLIVIEPEEVFDVAPNKDTLQQ